MLYMLSKSTYAVQPYQVGGKDRKSLVIVIPARLAKKYDINTSTIFAIQSDDTRNRIVLEMVDLTSQKILIPTQESSKAADQQAPLIIHEG
jgi:hypothetical protein